jgi:hypothetical protein
VATARATVEAPKAAHANGHNGSNRKKEPARIPARAKQAELASVGTPAKSESVFPLDDEEEFKKF